MKKSGTYQDKKKADQGVKYKFIISDYLPEISLKSKVNQGYIGSGNKHEYGYYYFNVW